MATMLSSQLRAHWSTLQQSTDLVSLGAIGYAAIVNEEAAAYMELTNRANRRHLPQLRDELVATASRPGPTAPRVYAALLLRHVDAQLATDLLHQMRGSSEPCSYAPGGCSIVGETLDRVASAILDVSPIEIESDEELWKLKFDLLELAGAPLFVEPDADGNNSWAKEFARLLLRDDLHTQVSVIEDMGRQPGPAKLYAAIFMYRVDRERGLGQLRELTGAVGRVRLLAEASDGRTDAPISYMAKRWLDYLQSLT